MENVVLSVGEKQCIVALPPAKSRLKRMTGVLTSDWSEPFADAALGNRDDIVLQCNVDPKGCPRDHVKSWSWGFMGYHGVMSQQCRAVHETRVHSLDDRADILKSRFWIASSMGGKSAGRGSGDKLGNVWKCWECMGLYGNVMHCYVLCSDGMWWNVMDSDG